jgi:hypothetical protein
MSTVTSEWRDCVGITTSDHHIRLTADVRLDPQQARELGQALWTAAWNVEHPTAEQLAERDERNTRAQRELSDDLHEFGRQLGRELAAEIGWIPSGSDPDIPF